MKNTEEEAYEIVEEVWEIMWYRKLRRKFLFEFNDNSIIEGVDKIRNLRKIGVPTGDIVDTIHQRGLQIIATKPARQRMGNHEWKVMEKVVEIIRKEATEIRKDVEQFIKDEKDKKRAQKQKTRQNQLYQQDQSQPHQKEQPHQIEEEEKKDTTTEENKDKPTPKVSPKERKPSQDLTMYTGKVRKIAEATSEGYQETQKSRKTENLMHAPINARIMQGSYKGTKLANLVEDLALGPRLKKQRKKDPDKVGSQSSSQKDKRSFKAELKGTKQSDLEAKKSVIN